MTEGRGIIGADRAGVVANGKFDRINITLRDEYEVRVSEKRRVRAEKEESVYWKYDVQRRLASLVAVAVANEHHRNTIAAT